MKRIKTAQEQEVIDSVRKMCGNFLAEFILDKSQDVLKKSRAIKKLLNLNPSIKKVRIFIEGDFFQDFYLKYDRYAYPELKIWRTQVFARDNYTCQKCGQIGGRLEAHHLKRWVDYPELRFTLYNGQTLCKDCHSKTNKHKSENNAIQ